MLKTEPPESMNFLGFCSKKHQNIINQIKNAALKSINFFISLLKYP